MILGNARMVTSTGVLMPGWLHVADGQISALGAGNAPAPVEVDLAGQWLVPGFVDIHAHGALGRSFDEASTYAVDTITGHHRQFGTTTMLASLVTAPIEQMRRAISTLAPHVERGAIAGVHLEGPFLSHDHCGAHVPQHLREPDRGAIDTLLHAAPKAVRMVTLAPELPGALEAIERIAARGLVCAIGHTAANYETTHAAIAAGARVATHLYNGMPPIRGREPGPVAALLADDRVTVELIADGIHLHDATLHSTANAAPGRFALVTDAMAATGGGDGEYRLGTQRVQVRHGQARLIDGDSLAGSTLTLDQALRTAVRTGIPFLDALAAATSTPAHAAGLATTCGTIAAGRAADLVVLDDHLTVRSVLHQGQWVPRDQSPRPTST